MCASAALDIPFSIQKCSVRSKLEGGDRKPLNTTGVRKSWHLS